MSMEKINKIKKEEKIKRETLNEYHSKYSHYIYKKINDYLEPLNSHINNILDCESIIAGSLELLNDNVLSLNKDESYKIKTLLSYNKEILKANEKIKDKIYEIKMLYEGAKNVNEDILKFGL